VAKTITKSAFSKRFLQKVNFNTFSLPIKWSSEITPSSIIINIEVVVLIPMIHTSLQFVFIKYLCSKTSLFVRKSRFCMKNDQKISENQSDFDKLWGSAGRVHYVFFLICAHNSPWFHCHVEDMII
jgi:hypothetical protein